MCAPDATAAALEVGGQMSLFDEKHLFRLREAPRHQSVEVDSACHPRTVDSHVIGPGISLLVNDAQCLLPEDVEYRQRHVSGFRELNMYRGGRIEGIWIVLRERIDTRQRRRPALHPDRRGDLDYSIHVLQWYHS